MMSTVIGLFPSDESAQHAIYQLKTTGFTAGNHPSGIICSTQASLARELIAGSEKQIEARYAGWGAVAGVALLGLYSLSAGAYLCNLCGYSPLFWARNLIGFVIIGAILGMAAGWFMGADKLEQLTGLYTQSLRRGGEMVAITVNHELVPQAMRLLRQEHALGLADLRDIPASPSPAAAAQSASFQLSLQLYLKILTYLALASFFISMILIHSE